MTFCNLSGGTGLRTSSLLDVFCTYLRFTLQRVIIKKNCAPNSINSWCSYYQHFKCFHRDISLQIVFTLFCYIFSMWTAALGNWKQIWIVVHHLLTWLLLILKLHAVLCENFVQHLKSLFL